MAPKKRPTNRLPTGRLPTQNSLKNPLKNSSPKKIRELKTGSKTADDLQRTTAQLVDSRLKRLYSDSVYGFLRHIPYPLLRLLPFLRQDAKQLLQTFRDPKSTDFSDTEDATPSDEVDPSEGSGTQSAIVPFKSRYSRYRCSHNPLTCHLSQTFSTETEKDSQDQTRQCHQCGFPSLLAESEIKGRKGRYQVQQFLGQRGQARLYSGQDIDRRQPVVIREFLLPNKYFNTSEQYLIRETFETIAGLKLADGRDQAFRLVNPWEAISDRHYPERCYLITQGEVDAYPTLRSHLLAKGNVSPAQLRQILNQILQTLESLHDQKYVLPAGQIQDGVVHGNLTLDSVVILFEDNTYYETPQLLVFLRDLHLWETLFTLPPTSTHVPTVTDDLIAVGTLGFYLLKGNWLDEYGRTLNPHNLQTWPGADLALEQYLRQLIGLEKVSFKNAQAARQALLQLSVPPPTPHQLTAPTVETTEKTPRRSSLWWLIILGGTGLLTALALGWWWSRRQSVAAAAPPLCCVAEVSAVPPGEFTYAAERQGIWYPLWVSRNLIVADKTLEQILETAQPDLDLKLTPTSSRAAALTQVLDDSAEFAIAPFTQHAIKYTSEFTELATDLMAKPIAYDGLSVFVAFSYVDRDRGLPTHLKGQITLAQLRQLYTGNITNWQELGGPDLPVKLYLPTQPELIEIFEEKVLQTPETITNFRRYWGLNDSRLSEQDNASETVSNTLTDTFISTNAGTVTGEKLPPLEMLRQVLQDFENQPQVGSIGFASFSQTYGQCSVYPLAIATDHSSPIQALHHKTNNTPINPADDLCADKGSYEQKQTLFANQHDSPAYPLAYPLAVYHRLDNSRVAIAPSFIQMLTTNEGQQLLKETGLVPLKPIRP